MAKCPYCGNELERYDEKRHYCAQCNKYFTVQKQEAQKTQAQSPDNGEIAELKARIATLEAERQQAPIHKTRINKSTLLASPVWAWFKKYGKIILPAILVLIIFITLMVCLVGIRGVYVNIDNPNEFYSFTATDYEYHGVSSFSGEPYVDKGTWKTKGNVLYLTYKDPDFGVKVTDDYEFKNQNNETLIIDGDFGLEKTFKRISVVNYQALAKKVKVTFDSCNGEQAVVKKIKVGSMLNNVKNPTRLGSNFLGWYTEKDGQGNPLNKYSSLWEDTIYYADWDIEWNISKEGILTGIDGSKNKIPSDLIIPNGVTKIDSLAFADCINIINIIIPNSVKCIYKNAFQGCTSVKSITLPSVEIIADENGSTGVNHPYFSRIFGIGYGNEQNIDLEEIIILGGELSESTFQDCTMRKITLPESVTYLPYGVFANCDNLTEVIGLDHVTTIGQSAFSYCDSISNLTIPTSVTHIYNSAFYSCTSLTSVTIPSSVTSIGGYVFSDCDNLKTIYCEAESEPEGWDERWLWRCNAEVIWGYKG